MSLRLHTYSPSEIPALCDQPLSVSQLQAFADDIVAYVDRYRPEYSRLVRLQQSAGNRVQEMFEPERWSFPTSGSVQIRPQKGNATRVISLQDLGFNSSDALSPVLADMARLPRGQYERAVTKAAKEIGLWRLYESGFAHPSTHFFRHLKIKSMRAENFDLDFIASWIGEKNVKNLNYYLDSQYFCEV